MRQLQTTPIAIIGMGCRFPGQADTPEKLWEVCAAARNTWSGWPKERLNEQAFTHPQPEHLGSFHSAGGHFLTEDPARWDASFFNFTADMSKAMDPQVRLLLETTFEAFQTAGLTLDQIAGSETAVFAGSMFRDYHDLLMRDPENLPRYHVTGNAAAFTANRLSHFFDLRGPSVSVDTACSTTLAALHLACQSLRAGESSMAVVGGANLILHPGSSMSLSNLGLTGKSGKSYGFDAAAEGYGRGEGIASVVLKPLAAALRDGDPVRAVIRETGMNQDGKTATITTPSQAAQERLIRGCYARAGLDPRDTAYVEAHGTGTRAGDGVELRALGGVLGRGRDPQDETPLYVGSVKANFGHTESTSGLAAVIKVAMMLQHDRIPPQALFTQENPGIDFSGLNIKIPTELMSWPEGRLRRASISNFGAGGANTHVIIEDARYLVPSPEAAEALSRRSSGEGALWSPWTDCGASPVENPTPGTPPSGHEDDEASSCPLPLSPPGHRQVFVLSARDESSLQAVVHRLADFLDTSSRRCVSLPDLAYTLNERRTHFGWRVAGSAATQTELLRMLTDGSLKPRSTPSAAPRLGFVFTGQGAQWHAMGRELVAYPVFSDALREAGGCLRKLGSEWDLLEELSRSQEDSRLDLPYLSFPVTVILQLALVRLLDAWGIQPSATTGHSSGEIAAAFAAGALSFEEAIAVAYIRGRLTHDFVQAGRARGAMTAVAVSQTKAAEYMKAAGTGPAAVVACVNSPASVTLSGDGTALEKIEALARADHAFVRRLRVPAAYHSAEMEALASDYLAGLCAHVQGPRDLTATFSSPVTGGLISDAGLVRDPGHWVRNMTQPVQFDDCLRAMILGADPALGRSVPQVDVLVEIGPHGTLQGPIRQILDDMGQPGLKAHVSSCLRRSEDAIKTTQELAAFLHCRGQRVDLALVNQSEGGGHHRATISDLPMYPWNHTARYWDVPGVAQDYLQRAHAHHDILGTRVEGLNPDTAVWRNTLRLASLPWVQHHVVQSEILFPAAGLVVMVTEAMRQLDGADRRYAYELRGIDLAAAVVVPKTQDPVEIQLVVRSPLGPGPSDDVPAEKEFAFYSRTASGGGWTHHCHGRVARAVGQPATTPLQGSLNLLPMDVGRFYKFVERTGPSLGPSFRNVTRLAAGGGSAEITVTVPDTLAMTPSPSPSDCMVHPTTLDTCLHAAWGALSETMQRTMGLCVPRTIKSLFVSPHLPSAAGAELGLAVHAVHESQSGFEVCVSVFDGSDPSRAPLIEIDGLAMVSIAEAAAPGPGEELMLLQTVWEPSLDFLTPADLQTRITEPPPAEERETFHELLQATYNVIHDHLARLTPEAEAQLAWHHRKYVAWMREQDAAFYAAHAVADEAAKRALYARVAAASVNGRMLVVVDQHLPVFLRGEADPLEVLARDGFLSEYYANMIKLTRCLGHVEKYARLFAHTHPGARVLEIGAGTGSCTEAALRGLTRDAKEEEEAASSGSYVFTDVSAGFFEAAGRRFAAHADRLAFRKLDIEHDPAAQGFAAGTYDLVLSCNCLHATKSLTRTLQHARALLRPGGKLVLLETTTPHVDQSLTFGLFPGWWLSEEAERADSPLLSAPAWSRYLAAAGFGGLDVALGDAGPAEASNYSVMVATAVEEPVAPSLRPRNTVGLTQFPLEVGIPAQSFESLRAALDSTMGAELCQLDAKSPLISEVSTVVVLATGESTLSALTADQFDTLKALMLAAGKVLWVSRGAALDTPCPEAALHTGLLRTLRLEQGSEKYVSLCLDPEQDVWHADSLQAICGVLHAMDAGNVPEYELAVRNGEVLVPRLQRHTAQHEQMVQKPPGRDEFGQPLALNGLNLDPSAAYLVVGGLMGVGREVVRWLTRQGAKTVIAVSRRGATTAAETRVLEAELATRGAQLIPYACDVADGADVARFLELVGRLMPVRGVVHAALALADAAWADMTWAQWRTPLAAKYAGTRHLAAAWTEDADLDFFVTLSSVTGLVGSHGQANYTAASTFQDALARHRAARGRPAVSVALGAVLGAGYVARTAGVADHAARAGWRVHDVREVLRLVELGIRHPHAGEVLAGVAPWTAGDEEGQAPTSAPAWRRERRFAAVPRRPRPGDHGGPASRAGDQDAGDGLSLGERLRAPATTAARLELLAAALRRRLAEMFVLAPEAVDADQPLAALGVDSLVAVELRNWLAAAVVPTATIFDVTQSRSLGALAEKMAAKVAASL